MKVRVLVSGSENFVGARVLAALSASDWAAPLAVASGDVWRLGRALAAVDAVAHCVGGEPGLIESSAAALYGGLASSCTAAAPRVVHVSSMTVYGSAVGTIDEEAEPRADLGQYSRAQRRAEAIATDYRNRVVLRPGAEYGADCPDWSGRVAGWLQAFRLGDLGAAGDGYANLLYIDDLVHAILISLRQPGIEGEIFNLALADKPTWNEYFSAFAQALGAVPVRRISHRRLTAETRLLAPPLKAAQLLVRVLRLRRLAPPAPIPPSLLRLCAQEINLSVAKAERLLGMRWTPLAQGLERAAQAYRRR
jgi:nucleoside-diphosphate-sugar epimerase